MKTSRSRATMKKMIASAGLGLAVAAAGCGVAEQGEDLASAPSALLDGNKFRGSDTLKEAIQEAIVASGVTNLVYEGTGSGNGAKCLIGSPADAVCAAAKQTIAPMSRPFSEAECKNGKVTLSSHVIALDAVNVIVKADQVKGKDAQITIPQLRSLYAGGAPETSTGDASDCHNGKRTRLWTQLCPSAKDGGPIVVYRRSDESGTTDIFKAVVGIKSFCPDVTVIEESATESETDQILRLTSTQQRAIGYAGDSGLNPSGANAALAVAQTASGPYVSPSVASIRLLQTDPARAYPLARRLFLNESVGGPAAAPREPSEAAFLGWALGKADLATARSFTQILVAKGFTSCNADLLAPCARFDPCAP